MMSLEVRTSFFSVCGWADGRSDVMALLVKEAIATPWIREGGWGRGRGRGLQCFYDVL